MDVSICVILNWNFILTFKWKSGIDLRGYKPKCIDIEYGQVGRAFANGPGGLGSIPRCIIPKTLKMVLDTSLLNTLQYKVRIMDKVEQSRERSSALPYTSV